MHKIVSIDVTKNRWNSPIKDISKVDEQLNQSVWVEREKVGITSGFSLNGLDDPGFTETEGSAITTTSPSEVIYLEPGMTIDSVGSGKTVEEDLTRVGDTFIGTLPVSFYRNVWFDALDALPHEHWELTISITIPNSIIPNAILLPDTQVRGRYVTR